MLKKRLGLIFGSEQFYTGWLGTNAYGGPMEHFKVERHSPTEWRIVNRRIGHGLLFTDEKLANTTAGAMNLLFQTWIDGGMEDNPFPERKGGP